jgi:hypothetical protein
MTGWIGVVFVLCINVICENKIFIIS